MYAHATRSLNSELLWCLLCNSQTIKANRMEKAHIQLMASRSRDLYIDILSLIYCSIYQYIGCTKRTFQVQNAHLLHYPQHTTAQEMWCIHQMCLQFQMWFDASWVNYFTGILSMFWLQINKTSWQPCDNTVQFTPHQNAQYIVKTGKQTAFENKNFIEAFMLMLIKKLVRSAKRPKVHCKC